MPVSHLGLTVSHLPSAASFYLSALQPLGYRFIGSQGDSIGLGIQDADFFITQGPRGLVITPTHIAFASDDRTQVRECYASALGAGGRPSGPPGYRNNSCSCFNAAVEDLDGNTIEFIFRENGPCEEEPAHAASEHSRVLSWQEGVSREAADGMPEDDAASMASKAQSRARTALDLASTTAKSTKQGSGEPSASATEKAMSALSNGISPKAILGGVIGAAAAGAIAYAFYQSEQDSARKEEAHEALMASYERGRPMSNRAQTTQVPTKASAYAPNHAPTHAPTQAPSRAPTAMKRSLSAAPPRTSRFHRNFSTTESIAPPPRNHRNFSVTESRVGPRPPPTKTPTQAPTALKAIEARAFDNDSEIQDAMSRFTSRRTEAIEDSKPQDAKSRFSTRRTEAIEDNKPQDAISRHSTRRPQIDEDSEVQAAVSRNTTINRRPQVTRSQTFDATSAYAPVSSMGGRSRGPPQRSATLNDDPSRHEQLFLEGPKDLVPSHSSLRSNRDDDDSLRRHDSGASGLSHRSSKISKMGVEERRSSASHVSAAKSAKEGSKYEGSRHESRHEGSRHEGSRHESARYEGSRNEGSRYEDSRHEGSRHESSNHGASRHGSLRDPDALSDASTIKASRRDSAAHIQSPSKANSKAPSRVTAAEYRLPDSPVPSYYAPPPEQPSRAASQMTALRVPLPPSRAPSHISAAQPPIAPSRRGSQVSAAQPSVAMHRRASVASGSAAGIPLPNSLASGRGYEDVDDSDGMGDMKTVIPDDSISCIEPNVLKSARSDVSRHSERSHRSHRSHHSSRSKHTHRREDEGERAPGDAKTIVPEDSISSVGSKQARSEHSHRSHRDHKSHHSSRSKHSKSHDYEKEKEEAPLDVRSHHSSRSKRSHRHEEAAEREPSDAKTIVPEDSISSVGARPRSEHSHHTSRSKHSRSHEPEKEKDKEDVPLDARSHHSSRSKRSHRHEESGERDPGDTKTIVPGDSISSVGAPARSEHSHHSRRSERDSKSHHSSRSSKKHDEDKEKKSSKEGRTISESGKSDVTVKPAKSKVSAMTLPGRLFGGKEDKDKSKKSDKRSIASYA